jgi:hypothetical protein
MFTHRYKSFYIHGYVARPECSVTFLHGGEVIPRKFKSYRAAQLFITKLENYSKLN